MWSNIEEMFEGYTWLMNFAPHFVFFNDHFIDIVYVASDRVNVRISRPIFE